MAPEQILNYRFVKPAADVYSAGVSVYYLLTGSMPFDYPSPLERRLYAGRTSPRKNVLSVVLEGKPIAIRDRSSALPPTLAAIVDRAVRKTENDRFKTAGDMLSALEEAFPELLARHKRTGIRKVGAA